jgi:hypothetical protein
MPEIASPNSNTNRDSTQISRFQIDHSALLRGSLTVPGG